MEKYVSLDGFYYFSVLSKDSSTFCIRIRGQRCLFQIEKDIAHRIMDSHKGNEVYASRKLIKFIFLKTEKSLNIFGYNSESIRNLITGKDNKEIINRVPYLLKGFCCED